jgi:hypothetical protein
MNGRPRRLNRRSGGPCAFMVLVRKRHQSSRRSGRSSSARFADLREPEPLVQRAQAELRITRGGRDAVRAADAELGYHGFRLAASQPRGNARSLKTDVFTATGVNERLKRLIVDLVAVRNGRVTAL